MSSKETAPVSDQPSDKPVRRQRVIKPRLQAWLVGSFLGLSLLGLTVQFLLFGYLALSFANGVPSGGEYLIDALPRMLLLALGGSMLVLLPVTALVGIAVTFRVAGPVHHFETHLRQVIRGEDPGPCRIRHGDRLQELCVLINEALAAARASGPSVTPASDGTRDDARAA